MFAILRRLKAKLVERITMVRRSRLLDWFAANAPKTGTSSVELVREDRETR